MKKPVVFPMIFIWIIDAMFSLHGYVIRFIRGETTVYVTEYDLYKAMFKEPFEILLVQMKNGKIYAINTGDYIWVDVDAVYLQEYLKKRGLQIADILLIVHNHPTPKRFTSGDNKFYCDLVNRGFEGEFQIYYPFSGKVLPKEKK